MLFTLSALGAQHSISFALAAIIVLLAGTYLTLGLFHTARMNKGAKSLVWCVVAGIVGGGSLWTSQLLLMLGFDPGVEHGYISGVPTKALVLGMLLVMIGFVLARRSVASITVEVGGAVVGLAICVMHTLAFSAFRIAGNVSFDVFTLAMGMGAAIIFSILGVNRAVRDTQGKVNRRLALAAFACAFASIHTFSLLSIQLSPIPEMPLADTLVSSDMMFTAVMSRVVSIMAIGLMAFALDHYGKQDNLDRFRHLALHDTLTGIPNRLHLNRTLDELLFSKRYRAGQMAVVAFDLNRFKDINDVHSHSAGDHVLRTVAKRLAASMEEGEFVARIGGDEFVAFKTPVHSRDQAKAFATKIKKEIIEGIDWDGRVLNVGSSIGISLFPDDGTSRDELIGKADLAMYRAKRTVSNGIAHYNADLDEQSREKSAISMDVRHAIERGEFELVYQPQHRVFDRKLIGFEVLLRWNHPERGQITPDLFIPVVERDGYIKIIGEWVLREACREAAKWNEPLKIAVNVAASQLAGTRLPRVVREALVEAGLPAHRLELEITESGIIPDPSHAEAIVKELKEIGVSVAMDDFGTGYSSLSTLQSIPFDKIKIDKAFVQGINSNPQSEAIVKSTVKLGDWLGISVLAEGVETEDHMRFLNEIGCSQVQGFLFGRPGAGPTSSEAFTAANVVPLRGTAL